MKMLAGALAIAAVTVTACSNSSTPPTSAARPPTTAADITPSPSHSPVGSDPHTTRLLAGTRIGSAVEIRVTNRIRHQLVTSGAAGQGFPRADYVGVAIDFLARDSDTGDIWAAGKLWPNQRSERAQIAQQDNGGYQVWERRPVSGWRMWDVGGFGGPTSHQHACPVPIPSSLRTLWKLRPDTCRSRLS